MKTGTLMSEREAALHEAVAQERGDASSEAGAHRLREKILDVYRKRFRCDPPEIEIVEVQCPHRDETMFVLRSAVRFSFPKAAT